MQLHTASQCPGKAQQQKHTCTAGPSIPVRQIRLTHLKLRNICSHWLGPSGRLGAPRRSRQQQSIRCSTFSSIPLPGDDQQGLIYSALHNSDDAAAAALKIEAAANKEKGEAAQGNGADPSNPNPGPSKGRVPHRWQVVGMMGLAFVLCNMDKVNMSVAVIPMAEELGWSATDRGLVSSAFFWGYSLTQIPAGYVSTKIGGATVLLVGVGLWSLGTVVAPPLAHMSLLALCASRVFVGLGEGLAPSSATNVMARLIPEKERSRAVTAVFGGLDVGSAVGLVLCGPLIRHYGWASVFYLFAVLGLVWCMVWPQLKPGDADPDLPPAQQPDANANGAKPDGGEQQPVPWGRFMTSAPVWAVIVAHFCFNWGYYTLLAWLPSYFELALGLNVERSSLLTLIPYIAMTCMTPFVGPIADKLVDNGWTVTNVRKLAQGISFAGPSLCMLACAYLTPSGARHTASAISGTVPVSIIVALLSISFALGAWSRAGLYCNHQDLSPKYAGALLGISNTAGAFPGILGVSAVGFLLDRTDSWANALFLPTAAAQLFGLVIYTIFGSSKRINFDADAA